MRIGTANNASPAPSRVLRPRHNTQVSKGRSNTETSSPSVLSPVGSADYTHQGNHGPESTNLSSSLTSSPTIDVEPGYEASHIAVRGSAPPSPILKAMRLKVKDNTYAREQTPSPGGWIPADEKARTEKDGLAESGSVEEVTVGESDAQSEPFASIPVPRTANNGRVIAIDLDLVLPRPASGAGGEGGPNGANGVTEPIMGAQVQVIDEPEAVMSPTQMKGATSGLLLALKQLRGLGHPLHLIACRPRSERSEIEFWLAGQGISLGTDDEDIVAALWFTESSSPSPGGNEVGGAGRGQGAIWLGARNLPQNQGDPKLKASLTVLRAMNAALFVTNLMGMNPALAATAPDLLFIALDDKTSLSSPPRDGKDAPKTGRIDSVDEANATFSQAGHSSIVHGSRWSEVVAWVKAWDSN